MRCAVLKGGAIALMAALAAVPGLSATPLLISPTLVRLPSDGRRSATIEVSNQSDTVVDVQLRGYDWSQSAGEDVLTPSSALAISPAIATIPARGRQIYRILDLGPPPAGEKAFRIRINELPKPGEASAVAVNLEFLVPVFRGEEQAPVAAVWSRGGKGIVVANPGARHIRMTNVQAIAAGGAHGPLSGAGPIYVLPGARRAFPDVSPDTARVTGVSDGGAFDVTLPPLR